MAKTHKNTKFSQLIQVWELKIGQQLGTDFKFSKKQTTKLNRKKTTKSFKRTVERIAGGAKGAYIKKQLAQDPNAFLRQQQKTINKMLEKDPMNMKLRRQKLKNTERLNRLLEQDPNLTEQERASMIDRHERSEARMAEAIHNRDEIHIQEAGFTKAGFVEEYFSSDYETWKEEKMKEWQKEGSEYVNMSDEELKNAYFDDKLSGESNMKQAEQHNGWYAYKHGDGSYSIIYDN